MNIITNSNSNSPNTIIIVTVLGTRPEITKLWSFINACNADPEIKHFLIHTGQHYDFEMSSIFLEELNIPKPDFFLNVGSGTHSEQTARILEELEKVLIKLNPSVVVTQGDTNTTLSSALTAVKLKIPVAHIEAGARSFDFTMPEELNRILVDNISSVFFAPTKVCAFNLQREGKHQKDIHILGNSISDVVAAFKTSSLKKKLDINLPSDYILSTIHRAENVDSKNRLKSILNSLNGLPYPVVIPLHPRTLKRLSEFSLTKFVDNSKQIHVIKPVGYLAFLKLLQNAKLVLTDSGGIQTEAAELGIPCVTIRDTTEWPETIWTGWNLLSAPNEKSIIKIVNKQLNQKTRKDFSPLLTNVGKNIANTLKNILRNKEIKFMKFDMINEGYPLSHLERTPTNHDIISSKYTKSGRITISRDSYEYSTILKQVSWNQSDEELRKLL
ncbi:MAG: non-hydrolyzing UDP-N-acetylglucosamine 2-epimerase [Candidatus Hodarchaeales archaeon]|jgi:UDP-N-acetylglucosamine 2-epimerase (non-hydrolysing)